MRGSDEPASLVATAELLQADRATKLGRSILPNPSCPPTPSGAEHAKKPEPIQALLRAERQRRTELTIPARLKKPAVGEVQVDLLAQPPLGANAKAIADDQHPDHQLRVNRGPTHLAVKRRQLAPQSVEVDRSIDRYRCSAGT